MIGWDGEKGIPPLIKINGARRYIGWDVKRIDKIGEQIKALRKRADLTLTELAEISSLSAILKPAS